MSNREAAAASERPLPPLPQAVDFSDVPSVAHVWGYTAEQIRERDAMWLARLEAASAPLSDEQIDDVARRLFCTADEDKEGDWGPDTLNQMWLEDIGRPFAQAIEAAHGIVPLAPQDSTKEGRRNELR